jgi:hypothetical protein
MPQHRCRRELRCIWSGSIPRLTRRNRDHSRHRGVRLQIMQTHSSERARMADGALAFDHACKLVRSRLQAWMQGHAPCLNGWMRHTVRAAPPGGQTMKSRNGPDWATIIASCGAKSRPWRRHQQQSNISDVLRSSDMSRTWAKRHEWPICDIGHAAVSGALGRTCI